MPEIIMPAIYGLFLVLAGMLIGFKLWYRDRSSEDALTLQLHNENETLQSRVLHQTTAITEMETQVSHQQGKLHILQELCDDLVKGRQQFQLDRVELEAELATQRKQQSLVQSQLQDETQRRVFAEDLLHKTQQDNLQNVSSMETGWREKCARLQSQLATSQHNYQQSLESYERTQEKLQAAESKLAELESDLATQQTLLETATSNASGLHHEYVSLEYSLKSYTEQLKEMRSECAVAVSARQEAETRLEELRQITVDQRTKIETLESRTSTFDSIQTQCVSLEDALAQAKQRLTELSSQRDQAMGTAHTLRDEMDGLQNRLTNQEGTIRQLRNQQSDHAQMLQQEKTARLEAESSIQDVRGKLQHLVDQRDQAFAEVQALEEKLPTIDSLQVEVHNKHIQIEKLTQDRDRLAADLAQVEAQYQQLETDFLNSTTTYQTDIAQLQSEFESQRALWVADQEELFEAQGQEIKARLEQVIQQRDRAFDDAEQLSNEIESLKQDTDLLRKRAKANEETIRNLRRERAAVITRNRFVESPTIIKAAFGQPKTQHEPEYGGTIRKDQVRGNVYVEPPQFRDDLKKISGIAHVLERRLNEYGIYTYKQIMEWDKTAIDEFSHLLAFPDRIERDDWLGQARQFYFQAQKRAA